jgi:hypothetical protein
MEFLVAFESQDSFRKSLLRDSGTFLDYFQQFDREV